MRSDACPPAETSTGPDLALGLQLSEIPDDGVVGGHVGDDPVVLARVDGELVAISGACSHYSGPLKDGLRVGSTLRCPWHHACFDLRTGAALEAPALAPLDRWKVEQRDGKVFVRDKLAPAEPPQRPTSGDPKAIVIVGGGAAGFAAAQRLRDLGYDGKLTLLSADAIAPYDRPNLSKDYLAGEADPAWMPLKDAAFYAENRIELRLSITVTKIDPAARQVSLADGEALPYDALLLATGAEPNGRRTPRASTATTSSCCGARPTAMRHHSGARWSQGPPGGDRRQLHRPGSGWRRCERAGLAVHVIALEALPLERTLGPQLGRFIRGVHESRRQVSPWTNRQRL